MFRTTSEIYDSITAFHHALLKVQHKVFDSVDKERLELLIAFINEHERRIREDLLEMYKIKAYEDIKLDYISEGEFPKQCVNLQIDERMSIDEIIDMTLKFENCLIRFYEKIIEKCPAKDMKKIFENLLNLLKRERLDFIKYDHGVFFK